MTVAPSAFAVMLALMIAVRFAARWNPTVTVSTLTAAGTVNEAGLLIVSW